MVHTRFDEEVNEHGKRAKGVRTGNGTPTKRVKTFSAPAGERANERQPATPTGAKGKQQRREEAERLMKVREQLPVWTAREAIVEKVKENETIVLLGATGSGKTTQVPQFLLDAKYESIACTQPRRVAAITLASRVAQESGAVLGGRVGYTVRFDDRTSERTKLRYMTDGSLLAGMLSDQHLSKYEVVIVDEAHERSLRTDMLLGFLKQAQKARRATDNPLKIIVMSATIDAERFSAFFDKAPIVYVEGRLHDVRLLYTDKPVTDYIEAAIATIMACHLQRNPAGTILVFLPGQDDIEAVSTSLKAYMPDLAKNFADKPSLEICPLYARLAPSEQARAFAPAAPKTRKVVLATNVAETSITIPGVRFVIDTGLAKEKTYDSATNIDSLQCQTISKSSAKQRAGRAGREAPGLCFRLYTEKDYDEMAETSLPEIQRVALPFALLHLLASGAPNVFTFPYMDKPDIDHMESALTELIGLSAVDKEQHVTKTGHSMAKLPLEPHYACSLLASLDRGCVQMVLSLVALVSARDSIFVNPSSSAAKDKAIEARSKFVHRRGDHLTLLSILAAFEETDKDQQKAWCRENYVHHRGMLQVLDTRRQLRERLEHMGIDVDGSASTTAFATIEEEEDAALECMLQGLYNRVAMRRQDNRFEHVITREPVAIHPSSALHGRGNLQGIMYDELILTSKPYARGVSSIDLRWLQAHPFFARR